MACEEQIENLKSKIDLIKAQFQGNLEKIAAEAKNAADSIDPGINKDDPLIYVGANFDIHWKRTDWSLDLPTIFIDDQHISFDLPNITMHTQDISFDLPTTHMERRRGPDYPEFIMDGLNLTVKMSPSYYDVPVIVMETQHFSMDLPEINMQRQDIVLGLPQVKMETQNFSFDVPEFILKDINAEAKLAKSKGDALQQSTQDKVDIEKSNFYIYAQQQTGTEFSALVDCQTHYLSDQLIQGLNKFDTVIQTMQGFINGLNAQKLPNDNIQLQNLIQSLNKAINDRIAFDTNINAQIQALPQLHETFIKNLLKVNKF